MSTLTIPRLSEHTHARLLRQAAENGRSVDAAVGLPDESTPMAVRRESSEAGGVDIEPPDRTDPPQDATSS